MSEHKIPKDIIEKLNVYLAEKGLRKTEGRYTVLDGICSFSKYFDITSLHKKVKTSRYPVSKAMLYNTIDLLVDAGIVIRHQPSATAVCYELRQLAETHVHFVCTQCGCMHETKRSTMQKNSFTIPKNCFAVDFALLYVFGRCEHCKTTARKKIKNLQ